MCQKSHSDLNCVRSAIHQYLYLNTVEIKTLLIDFDSLEILTKEIKIWKKIKATLPEKWKFAGGFVESHCKAAHGRGGF